MTKRAHPIAAAFAAILSFGLVSCGQPAETEHAGGHNIPPATAAREDADFALRLALIEGHLMVAQELIADGQAQNSLPHFGHPVRELYSDMLPVIARRGGEQFDRDLVALEGLVAAQGNSPEFQAAFAATLAKVRAARDLIPAEKWADDSFTLGIVADTVNVAAQEYRNAIVAGRIDSLIEYHDTRGFIYYLTDMLATRPSTDPRLAQAATLLADLHATVDQLNPPNPPRATPEQFEAKVAEIRALVDAPAPAAATP